MRKAIGARELKTRLGTYLRQVQEGVTLVVTERGRPVAEIRPLKFTEEGEAEARLNELVALGIVSRESPHPLPPFQPIRLRGASLAQAISEDREDRF